MYTLQAVRGPVFFGSAEGLADQVDALAGAETIILDMTGVATIDSTGVQVLKRIDGGLAKAGRHLLLAGVPPEQRALLADQRCCDDANAALMAAEDRLLAKLQPADDGALALADHPVLRGLSRGQIDILATVAEHRAFSAGEVIVAETDPADAVWLFTRGQATAYRGGVRVASFRAGAVFGERALLKTPPRRQSVLADSAAAAFRLLARDLDMLGRIDGRIPFVLMRNILAAAAAQNDKLADLVWER